MKRLPDEKPDGAPEWMVPFADMLTIMLAFFVIMFSFASAEARKGKQSAQQQAAVESLQGRFAAGWNPFASWTLTLGNRSLLGDRKDTSLSAATPNDPEGNVKQHKQERARIRVPGQGEQIVVGGRVTYGESTAQLPLPQRVHLQTIADELAGKPQQIEIVAIASQHRLPPGTAFRDRWDLAYARCRQTAELLATMQVEPDRLRLTVLPANESLSEKNPLFPDADTSVQIYLSRTSPAQLR